MKTLTINQMEACSSGSVQKLVDGVCVFWGTAVTFSIIAHNPITGGFATAMDVGCGLWGLYRFIS